MTGNLYLDMVKWFDKIDNIKQAYIMNTLLMQTAQSVIITA